MLINFYKLRRLFFAIYIITFAGSLFCITAFGLNLGIEFKGGTIVELEFDKQRPTIEEIKSKISELRLNESIQTIGEKGIIIRTPEGSPEKINKIKELLINVTEKRKESIGPMISKELVAKSKWITITSLILIFIYIFFSFSKVGKIISSSSLALISIIALLQNTVFILGIFSILGKFANVPFTIPVLVGILAIVGYGINDIIVVFDRLRENLLAKRGMTLENVINHSINSVLSRSINTSLTTIFPLIFVLLFLTESMRYFSLVMIIGIVNTTIFSIFVACPLIPFSASLTKKISKI